MILASNYPFLWMVILSRALQISISISTVKSFSMVKRIVFFLSFHPIWLAKLMFNCTSLVLPTKVEAGAAGLLTPPQWRQLSEGSLSTCRRSGMVQRLDPRSLSHQLVVSAIQVPSERMFIWAEETSRCSKHKTGAEGFNQIVSCIIANYNISTA